MRINEIKQLEGINTLNTFETARILGGKRGWLKRLFKRHPEVEHPNGDDSSKSSNTSSQKYEDSHRGRGRGSRG